jgi:16S rRNA (adenine1518-N6/adenine1519-N6)-dimethyltransferase
MDQQILAIKNELNKLGIRPSKSKGQNFLFNPQALQKIVSAADLRPTDYVLEIGPGLGILTEQLINHCQQVLAVELDKTLNFYLKKKFRGFKNFQLLEADILKVKNSQLYEKLAGAQKNISYKVVANLPYNISKPVLRKFLTYQPKPAEIIVLLQKEVAEKIAAQPGKLNLLALTVGFYGQAELVDYIEAACFYPKPQIDSAILKIKVRQTALPGELKKIFKSEDLKIFKEEKFWQLVKIGFSSPRKQLHNNLAAGFKGSSLESEKWLNLAGLTHNIRAQDLSLTDWLKLYRQIVS